MDGGLRCQLLPLNRKDVEDIKGSIGKADHVLNLNTANGEIRVDKTIDLKVPSIGANITAHVLEAGVNVLSMGKL